MTIGIDASRLTRVDRTGTENYLYFVLRELFKIDKENDYVLYFTEEPSPILLFELGMDKNRIRWKVLKKYISWTQISLSFELFKNPVDILYCTWHTMPGFYPFWRTKVVSVIHDITGRLLPTFWTVIFSNKIVSVSKSTFDSINKVFPSIKTKQNLIYEGYDKKDFYPRSLNEVDNIKRKYDIKGDYMLFIGSISPRKNIENMIKAYQKLNRNIDFILGGTPLAGYETMLNLPGHFIGRVPQEDMAPLYSGAKMFCFVSKEEGFGIPLLESMSCCTPVLTSNISALKEISGDAALLVDPNSIEEITTGMERILDDHAFATSLVEKGMSRLSLFSWETTALKTLDLFKRVYKREN